MQTMASKIWFLFLVLTIKLNFILSDKNDLKGDSRNLQQVNKKARRRKTTPQREAVIAWSAELSEDDESSKWWMENIHNNPPQIFDHYIVKLSKVFSRKSARLNFLSVGACDGTNDFTITNRFFKNAHWDGFFVEPMSLNYRDLVNQLKESNNFNRSFALRAAMTGYCDTPTITVQRPAYEDMGRLHVKHWLRRQIGGIKPKSQKKTKRDWIDEEVTCVTGPEVLGIWTKVTRGKDHKDVQTGYQFNPPSSVGSGEIQISMRRRRPHILKIDVEGHDFVVLSSFLNTTNTNELPLLISYEAKSLHDKFDSAVALLESKGYAVTPLKADGFALLKSHSMIASKSDSNGGGGGGGGKKKRGGNWRVQLEKAAAEGDSVAHSQE